MRVESICIPSALAAAFLTACVAICCAQATDVKTDIDAETILVEASGIGLNLPSGGYTWSNDAVEGDGQSGSMSLTHSKIIYYLLHWGPIEAEEITEEYVRERIPKIWPSEGFQIQSLRKITVAGHPAVFAEVIPRRDFYRPFFIVWNCPETGRQFIADMNYNISFHTPRAELEAEFETTLKTLACHPGAPTQETPGHVVPYESERFGVSFRHPLHWYVFESPYGVPHPAYKGIRDRSVGSLLAWLQDRQVELKLAWKPRPPAGEEEPGLMGSSAADIQEATKFAGGIEGIKSFAPQAGETITAGGRKVFKLLGIATNTEPEQTTPQFIPKSRMMVLLADGERTGKRLLVAVKIDFYGVDGVFHTPVRDIFDRWALAIAEGLDF